MGNTPNIRFKGFTDDWEQRKLGEICQRVIRKNKNNESDLPLTIASQYGLIDQRDFFNKVVAAKDMSNYYLLRKGEFAYNKSYSNGFEYGSIKRLNAYEQGCLSTLYICFEITSDEVDSDYLECFFDTLKWYGDLSMICAEGARNHGLLNVDIKAFFADINVSTPADVNGLSKKQKKTFIKLFRDLDHDYAHLKSFSTFEPEILDEYGFSQQIYEDYAAVYNNVIEELKKDPPDDTGDEPIRDDYDLVAYSKFKIDFEYIVELLQGFVDFLDQKDIEFNEAEFEHKLLELKEIVKDFAEDNPKLSDLLLQVLDEIEQDKAKFMGQDMSVIINQMRYSAIDKEIEKFSKKWYVPFEAVKYEAYNYKDGELANENKLKELADYATYKMETSEALPKFKFNGTLIREFKEILMPEIGSLIE